jgi:hypothetical protein
MWTRSSSIAALAFICTTAVTVLAGAQASQTKSDTYTWNGELVSLDTTAKTITVKSRVAYQDAVSELTHFKAGEHVWVVWSGIHDFSDAVRQVRRPETGRHIDENLVLPAQLVSMEAQHHDAYQGPGDCVVGDHNRQARRMGHGHVAPPAIAR